MSEIEATTPDLPKSNPAPIEPSNTEPPPIDPVLKEKLEQLLAIKNVHNILDNCLFPGAAAGDLLGAKQFLQNLHAPILKECQSHPDFQRASNPSPAAAPLSPEQLAAKAKADEKAKSKAQDKRERKAKRTRAN